MVMPNLGLGLQRSLHICNDGEEGLIFDEPFFRAGRLLVVLRTFSLFIFTTNKVLLFLFYRKLVLKKICAKGQNAKTGTLMIRLHSPCFFLLYHPAYKSMQGPAFP